MATGACCVWCSGRQRPPEQTALSDETDAGPVQRLPSPEQLHFLHEKTQDKPKVEKGYIKNQVTYQKNGLLYLANETCDQTQDKGFPDREPVNGSL